MSEDTTDAGDRRGWVKEKFFWVYNDTLGVLMQASQLGMWIAPPREQFKYHRRQERKVAKARQFLDEYEALCRHHHIVVTGLELRFSDTPEQMAAWMAELRAQYGAGRVLVAFGRFGPKTDEPDEGQEGGG